MHSTKPIAVVILNWNGEHLLSRYLPSVIAHTDSDLADIIIADNGSTDSSLSLLEEYAGQVSVIELKNNHGFARGYNLAIASLSHPYVLLLNSDVRVTPGWLSPLYSFISTHPDVVAVQPTIRWDRHPDTLEYAGALGGYLDYLGYPFCRGRIFSTLEKDQGQYGTLPLEVFWTSGACMLVRREEYISIGGLADDFFAHQEEIDLCWRWHSLGYRLYAIPTSVVYHYGGASLDSSNPRKTYLNFRNNLQMLQRNLPRSRRLHVFTVRFFLDGLAACMFLLRGKGKDFVAILRAWYHFWHTPKTPPLGGDAQLSYTKLYHHSILIRYYLHREKLFSQLKNMFS